MSANLTDHDVTPIHVAYEEVCKDAAALNLPVVGSEIVGLVPLVTLLQVCTSQGLYNLMPLLYLAARLQNTPLHSHLIVGALQTTYWKSKSVSFAMPCLPV